MSTRSGGRTRGRCRIGTSGYQYEHWREVLYPRGLPKRAWLPHYARHFESVEVNSTFYGLPAPEVFDAWREATPPGFCFALKFSRYGTHRKKLREPSLSLRPFLARARRLGARLGPLLVQLPPRWRADPPRLDAFLEAVPADLRVAVELRDERWWVAPVLEVLERHGAALCLHDLLPRRDPCQLTARWTYLRYHGTVPGGCYSPQRLSAEARRIAAWCAQGIDVYAYFNNDLGGHAVRNALQLERYLARRGGRAPASSHLAAPAGPPGAREGRPRGRRAPGRRDDARRPA